MIMTAHPLYAIVAITLIAAAPAGASACRLSVDPINGAPRGRVAGLHIEVPNAALETVIGIAPGWHVLIDNEPTWTIRISAHAILGPAFLDEGAPIPGIEPRPQPGHTCTSLNAAHAARVFVTRYLNDALHVGPLLPSQIRITAE